MKTKLRTLLFFVCITIASWAYKGRVVKGDGVSIYYDIKRSKENFNVAVKNKDYGTYNGVVNIRDKEEGEGM